MRRALVAALLVGALLGALRWWPANSLQALLPVPWQCLEWRGSVWQGACANLQNSAQAAGSLTWRVGIERRPWTRLWPRPIVELEWQSADRSARHSTMRAQLLPGRKVHLRSISLNADLETLQRAAGESKLLLAGRVSGQLEELVLTDDDLQVLRGTLQLSELRAGTAYPVPGMDLDRGIFKVAFDTAAEAGSRPTALLRDLAGPLQLRARAEFPPGRRVLIEGVVRTQAGNALPLRYEMRW